MYDTDIERQHAAALAAIDPLAALPAPLTEHGGGRLHRVGFADGAALGLATVARTTPDVPDALWGALHRHTLDIRLAGPDREEALDRLLSRWGRDIAEAETPGDWESSASITVPSRDLGLANVLSSHGFGLNNITAVRRRSEPTPAPVGVGGIRRARESDLDALAEYDLALMRHDGQFGGVNERPGARQMLREAMAQRFAAAPDWTHVAEEDGRVVGFLHVMPPGEGMADHFATTIHGTQGAYLVSAYVDPAARGARIGARLVATVHEGLDAAGVPVATLSQAAQNPLSSPFWARMGYRPLWTTWQRRPALLH